MRALGFNYLLGEPLSVAIQQSQFSSDPAFTVSIDIAANLVLDTQTNTASNLLPPVGLFGILSDMSLPTQFLALIEAEDFSAVQPEFISNISYATLKPVAPVPVPAALPLFGTGLAFMGFIGWRRKRKAAAA